MNKIIKKFNEGVISELCKVLAIRYKYADGEAMTWITKNILSVTKEIDGHQYGLKIVQLDGELPYMDDTDWTWKVNSGDYHITDLKKGATHQLKIMLKAGYKYRVIEEESNETLET